MKQKKRGFTLVELVIVIAVIAILAGVMIAVFANVVNKAEKSRQEQEMKQAELEQKSDDIIKKLENADWLSWEDIEVAIAEGLKGIDAGASSEDVSKAVDAAIKKYADSLGSGNTGVTEEQIKYIIENSLQGQLTATQVEAIVKKYQASSTVTLSASQINQIKEAASANSLTATQVQSIVKAISDGAVTSVTEAVKQAISDSSSSALTAEEANRIVTETLALYIRNGVAGDYGWYAEKQAAIEAAASGTPLTLKVGGKDGLSISEFKSIAGLSAEGVTFKGVTIELTEDIPLSGSTWTPIGTGATFEGTIKGTDAANPVTISGIKIDTSFNAAKNGFAISVDKVTGNADKYGVGFVASLGEGAVLENLVLEVNYDISDTGADGVLVGGAVGYLYGGTVKNVTVNGSVKNNYRVGGIVGGGFGTIENCINNATVVSTAKELKTGYHFAAGIIGYARNFSVAQNSEFAPETEGDANSVIIKNCTSNGSVTSNDTTNSTSTWNYGIVGQTSANIKVFLHSDTTNNTNATTNYWKQNDKNGNSSVVVGN